MPVESSPVAVTLPPTATSESTAFMPSKDALTLPVTSISEDHESIAVLLSPSVVTSPPTATVALVASIAVLYSFVVVTLPPTLTNGLSFDISSRPSTYFASIPVFAAFTFPLTLILLPLSAMIPMPLPVSS